jgi:formamidopyrimidine-DNA glycosylase
VLAVERVDAPPGPKTANLERAVGQRIEAVTRRGKFLLLPCGGRARRAGVDAPDELVVHLGMTGVLSPRPPASHLRLRLRLDGPEPDVLYVQDARRFGRVLVVPSGDYRTLPTLAAMGPEPLSSRLHRRRLRRRAGALGAAGQGLPAVAAAGVGRGQHLRRRGAVARPRAPADAGAPLSRPRARALHAAIREVLAAAVDLQGTTLYDYRTVNGEVGRVPREARRLRSRRRPVPALRHADRAHRGRSARHPPLPALPAARAAPRRARRAAAPRRRPGR